MEELKNIIGYLLGFLIFVCGVPALMWWVSGRALSYFPDNAFQGAIAIILMVVGVAFSVYTIVYMKIVGKGNPFDAYNHEVAPRTRHLMTGGPYRVCRNPMLLGIYVYDVGVLLCLFALAPILVFAVEVLLLSIQVRSEEKRLEADFGQEYLDFKQKRGRYLPFPLIRK